MLWCILETCPEDPGPSSSQLCKEKRKSLKFEGYESDRFIIFTHIQSFLFVRSSSLDPKDQCPTFSLKNGGISCAIELKRPVGTHCHGPGAVAREDRGDKWIAKKKLYIASAVCLVFMIGEVIGKSQTSVLVRIFDKGLSLQLLPAVVRGPSLFPHS